MPASTIESSTATLACPHCGHHPTTCLMCGATLDASQSAAASRPEKPTPVPSQSPEQGSLDDPTREPLETQSQPPAVYAHTDAPSANAQATAPPVTAIPWEWIRPNAIIFLAWVVFHIVTGLLESFGGIRPIPEPHWCSVLAATLLLMTPLFLYHGYRWNRIKEGPNDFQALSMLGSVLSITLLATLYCTFIPLKIILGILSGLYTICFLTFTVLIYKMWTTKKPKGYRNECSCFKCSSWRHIQLIPGCTCEMCQTALRERTEPSSSPPWQKAIGYVLFYLPTRAIKLTIDFAVTTLRE